MAFLGTTGLYSGTISSFKGLVINAADTSIEIKKGSKEITLFWTDQSKVLKDGKQYDRNSVVICQKVRASYTVRDGRRELITLEILSEGYCVK
jgi:hypothetical protein